MILFLMCVLSKRGTTEITKLRFTQYNTIWGFMFRFCKTVLHYNFFEFLERILSFQFLWFKLRSEKMICVRASAEACSWGNSGRVVIDWACKQYKTDILIDPIDGLKSQWEHYFPYNFLRNHQQNMIHLGSTLSQAVKYKQRCNDANSQKCNFISKLV